MNLDSVSRIASSAVLETGRFLRSLSDSERGVANTEVGGREVKLHADRRAHELLSGLLSTSGVPVISEEDKQSHSRSLDEVWVIDPLDGSYNFTRKLGHSMVSCAYVTDGIPRLGALFDIVTETLFLGGPDLPSKRDGELIRCSQLADLSAAVLCTGFPARFSFDSHGAADGYFTFMSSFAKVRMTGSAAHSLCLLAQGSAECYAERSIMFWDVAAGLAVAQGAGARLVRPQTYGFEPLSVVLTNAHLPERVTELMEESRAFHHQ
jgi:myo-inositol-1(or 4)-monophosphatase